MHVLLVEDDPGSAALTDTAIKQIRPASTISLVATGLEAIRHLESKQRPSLIITDIRMPELDGNRLINFVKSSAAYQSIPVVVLTASERPSDIQWAYTAGCNGYFIKPMDFDQLVAVLKIILMYWYTSKRPIDSFREN